MQRVYALSPVDNRKLKFLYQQSHINTRYSVIPDYSRPVNEWKFYPHSENLEPFPSLEQRMFVYEKFAAPLSVDAIRNCFEGYTANVEITHLITVSCTGMSAPGLDLQLMELLDLPRNILRTYINFMGCYAAIHALKIADSICATNRNARILIVCTELCTLHFQREPTPDNIASSLLFSDGSAALLVTSDDSPEDGIRLRSFYSEVLPKGRKDMAWELSSSGFLMTLSGYVPELIEQDFAALVSRSLEKSGLDIQSIKHWCIHPGGRRILDCIARSLSLENNNLGESYSILADYGNLSSPTILLVLKKILNTIRESGKPDQHVYGAAFGPGLTMETFVAET